MTDRWQISHGGWAYFTNETGRTQTRPVGSLDYNICLAELSELYLWALRTSGITHWQTSYRFTSQVDDGMIGMLVNMYQPISHQFSTGGMNHFSSLKLIMTPNKLTLRDPAVNFLVAFKTKVKVQHLIDLITNKQCYYYSFYLDGSGCMFWQLSLRDLKNMDG
jgi:hypothetical protein